MKKKDYEALSEFDVKRFQRQNHAKGIDENDTDSFSNDSSIMAIE